MMRTTGTYSLAVAAMLVFAGGVTSYLVQIVQNGSNPTALRAFDYSVLGDPAWSPEGRQIAITVLAPAGCGSCQDEVVLLSTAGMSLGQISGSARNPAWRP